MSIRRGLVIILVFWTVIALISIALLFIFDNPVYGNHICYTNTTSIVSHFDYANLTKITNVTHYVFCLAA